MAGMTCQIFTSSYRAPLLRTFSKRTLPLSLVYLCIETYLLLFYYRVTGVTVEAGTAVEATEEATVGRCIPNREGGFFSSPGFLAAGCSIMFSYKPYFRHLTQDGENESWQKCFVSFLV